MLTAQPLVALLNDLKFGVALLQRIGISRPTLTFLTSNSTPTNCLEMCAKRLGDAIFDCNQ